MKDSASLKEFPPGIDQETFLRASELPKTVNLLDPCSVRRGEWPADPAPELQSQVLGLSQEPGPPFKPCHLIPG